MRRIDVDTTSFWHQMPTGTVYSFLTINSISPIKHFDIKLQSHRLSYFSIQFFCRKVKAQISILNCGCDFDFYVSNTTFLVPEMGKPYYSARSVRYTALQFQHFVVSTVQYCPKLSEAVFFNYKKSKPTTT